MQDIWFIVLAPSNGISDSVSLGFGFFFSSFFSSRNAIHFLCVIGFSRFIKHAVSSLIWRLARQQSGDEMFLREHSDAVLNLRVLLFCFV